MCQIVRVEHADTGAGPYAGSMDFHFTRDVTEAGGPSHELKNAHPVEGWDRGQIFGAGRRWAFRDLKQLLAWFNHFGKIGYELLQSKGYTIRYYEVPDEFIIACLNQIVFDIEQATRLDIEENFPCF